MPNILRLQDLSPLDIDLAGGKAANLAALLQAHFPVPAGFILTSDAYRAFLAANRLESPVQCAAQQAGQMGPAELEETALALAQAFLTAEMPESLAAELRRAYANLGGGPVAVRSSATLEDRPEASFAGQQATYLNVLGEDDLFSAVCLCWSSLWSVRSLAYRARLAMPPEEIALAVIVQQMVRSEAAGVLFTANPTTQDPDEMVINAAQGFGEAVSSGTVTPHEIIINRSDWSVSHGELHGPALVPDATYLELARLSERVELHFGHPQDIEWGWSEGEFFILQARPITTPIHPRLVWKPPVPGKVYTRGGVTELMPEPVSLLFETVGLPALENGIRAYQQQVGPPKSLQGWSFAVINGYVYALANPKRKLSALLGLPRVLLNLDDAIRGWQQAALPAYRREVEALRANPAALSGRELLQRITALAAACAAYWAATATMLVEAERVEKRFRTLYRRLRREGDADPGVLMRSLENLPLEAEQALHAAGKDGLDAYACRYGHALYNFDFAAPLAAEDCSAFEASLQMWSAGAPSPSERRSRLLEEQRTAEERVRARLPGRLRSLFDRSLVEARSAARAREDALFELGLAWAPLRSFALELGSRLAAARALERPEQVFWLRWNELGVLASALDGGKDRLPSQAAKTRARQEARQAARAVTPPFSVPEHARPGLLWKGPAPAEGQRQGEHLSGAAASPGRVTGIARVIRRPAEFGRLGQGEILVAHATTPAWTPLFAVASGLVADLGGTLSHGSIIAREFGIPAVMGAAHATECIQDGQIITVDGDLGLVYL